MGKKGRKTRWRDLPINIGEGGRKENGGEVQEHHHNSSNISSTNFNKDEYTKITAPRQDMLFKKGYFVKKKSTTPNNPPQDSVETQSAGSLESEQYACEEQTPQFYNAGRYVDPSGRVYYMNNTYEIYDPYYGNMTVVVGPAPQYGAGPQPLLAAVPCQPVPLQPLEWFNPGAAQPFCLPVYPKKKGSIDSQSCSRQSSESTLPPGSPQESIESPDQSGVYMQPPAPYVYPGYMFGAPLYNVNGVNVQSVLPSQAPQPPPADQSKRRKKRKRRMRGAVADEGSESSYEEVLSCEASGESHSGASSDTAPGSSSSKTTFDSGIITTDVLVNSGSNSPLEIDEPVQSLDCFEPPLPTSVKEDVIIENFKPYTTIPEIKKKKCGKKNSKIDKSSPAHEKRDVELKEAIKCDNLNNINCDDISLNLTGQEVRPKDVIKEDFNGIDGHSNDSQVNGFPNEDDLVVVCEEMEKIKVTEVENNLESAVLIEEIEKNEDLDEITRIPSIDLCQFEDDTVEEAAKELLIERPITQAVTKWLQSQGTVISDISEDEGIEEGEEITGQKNGPGNPFLALYPSGARIRVAEDVADLDMEARVSSMCDPKSSVNKYYRLAAVPLDKSPLMKTAVHIGHPGPFPCGVCCIIQ